MSPHGSRCNLGYWKRIDFMHSRPYSSIGWSAALFNTLAIVAKNYHRRKETSEYSSQCKYYTSNSVFVCSKKYIAIITKLPLPSPASIILFPIFRTFRAILLLLVCKPAIRMDSRVGCRREKRIRRRARQLPRTPRWWRWRTRPINMQTASSWCSGRST